MPEINHNLTLPEGLLRFRFVLSSGPGGQNVNKVATAVQLRVRLDDLAMLSQAQRDRLARLAGSRVNKQGEIVITAQRYRQQERNRQEAIERLLSLIRKSLPEPKRRKKTKPSAQARARRVADKRRRGQTKQTRRKPARED